jgi:hypothetical protein
LTVTTRSPTKTIIFLSTTKENYRFEILYHDCKDFVTGLICPCCKTQGKFSRHGKYRKYYYRLLIGILRIRCKACKKTHAIIPTFSVPEGSFGMKETEAYLQARHEGTSRKKAAAPLLELGVSTEYPRFLERKFTTAVQRAKALFPESGDPHRHGYAWVSSWKMESRERLLHINRYGLTRGVNMVFFARSTILLYRHQRSGRRISHNHPSSAKAPVHLHSP